MHGRELPMLNGFPARLVVPGWYATYWVKNLSEIAVVDHVFEKFWMKPAYRIPDTPCGCVEPGTAPKSTVPIRSEEHTSELQSLTNLVCRLLLEKKKKKTDPHPS